MGDTARALPDPEDATLDFPSLSSTIKPREDYSQETGMPWWYSSRWKDQKRVLLNTVESEKDLPDRQERLSQS